MYMSGPLRLYKRHMLGDYVAICLKNLTVTKPEIIVVVRQTFQSNCFVFWFIHSFLHTAHFDSQLDTV